MKLNNDGVVAVLACGVIGFFLCLGIVCYQAFEVEKIKSLQENKPTINTECRVVNVLGNELKELRREIQELRDQIRREYTNQTLKANQVYTMPMYISTPAILKMNEYPEMFMGGGEK